MNPLGKDDGDDGIATLFNPQTSTLFELILKCVQVCRVVRFLRLWWEGLVGAGREGGGGRGGPGGGGGVSGIRKVM